MEIRLTQIQSSVVDHGDGAMLVVAGPGSGKTRVLTERIKKLLSREDEHFRVLALTFTNKAANEMRHRLETIPDVTTRAFIGTMHSFCTEVLANRGKSVGIDGLPHIFDSYQDRKQMLVDAVASLPDILDILNSSQDAKKKSSLLDSWLKQIGEFKNSLVLPEMVGDEQFGRLYAEYNAQLTASNAVDFDDLLLLTYRLFEERPKIAGFYQRQYQYICVDEAQDLNEVQYRVLCALCGSEYRNVMMVGDPKQAIFMWNGAHPKYMDLFEKDFEAKKIELTENFRSARAIVTAAQGLEPGYSLDGKLAVSGQLTIRQLQDEEAEAAFVCDELERLFRDGHLDVEGAITPNKCAIIGRNRFVFHAVAAALEARGIPFFKKIAGSGLKAESDCLKDFEICLRVLVNPLDRLHLGVLARRWTSNSNLEQVYEGIDLRSASGRELIERLGNASAGIASPVLVALAAIDWASSDFRLRDALSVFEHLANSEDGDQRALLLQDIAEWQRHWDAYVRSEAGGSRTPHAFLNQVALGTTEQPSGDGVALLTVHSAKGMEFEVVFMIAMNEGVFPDFRAKGSELEEERRNCFVGITRSRRLLYLSYMQKRLMPWGDYKWQTPSRFLNNLQGQGS